MLTMTNSLNAKVLNFLADLEANNNREWFHLQKSRYESEVKNPFEAFIGNLISAIQANGDSRIWITPRQAIFRIYRDTRFSANKLPYKTHLSAVISPFGTKSKEFPGFYLQWDTNSLWLGGGAYFLEKATLQSVREYIAEHSEEFSSLVHAADFVGHYGELLGEKNKRLTGEMAEMAADLPVLFHKQFYYMAELDPEILLKPDALQTVMRYYKAARPLCVFLEKAVSSGEFQKES